MRKSLTREEVQDILAQFRTSNQTQRHFAKSIGLKASTLAYWIRRERLETEANHSRKSTIVAVKHGIVSEVSREFKLEIPGFKMTVPRDVTVEELRRVREALTS